MVAADGGILTFGDAQFYGSTGSIRLNGPSWGWRAAEPSGPTEPPGSPGRAGPTRRSRPPRRRVDDAGLSNLAPSSHGK
jgi:hypothetical protein